MTEILTQVSEKHRADDDYQLSRTDVSNSKFYFARQDETLCIPFNHVSTYIEHGSEWADFYLEEDDEATVTICNEENEVWPHWLFEEFTHIETKGELRPTDEYLTRYETNEMYDRGRK